MKTKHLLLILLTLLIVVSCTSTRRFLIKKNDYLGWKMTDYKMLTSNKDFSNYLKENYNLYSGYGIKMILVQEIEGPSNMKLKIEIFKTRDQADANGLYNRYQSFSQIRVGDGGSESPGLVCFYKEDFFVKISAVRNLQDKNNYLINMAQLVSAKI